MRQVIGVVIALIFSCFFLITGTVITDEIMIYSFANENIPTYAIIITKIVLVFGLVIGLTKGIYEISNYFIKDE